MRRERLRWASVFLTIAAAFLLVASASADVGSGSGPPTSIGTGGAAASVEKIATQAAIDTLKEGGNAVDAAVAAAGVLGVTEPFSCGVGGGGFMVVRTSGGLVTAIDGRETAPRAMTPTSFWAGSPLAPLPFNDARFSGLSVGVPGTVATWAEALERYGTMTLARVLQPGIHVASHGFVVDQTFFDQTQQNVDYFDDVPATTALFLDSTAPRATSAASSPTRSLRRRINGSRTSGRKASTVGRWRTRSSTPFRIRSSRPPRTTRGGPA